MSETVTYAFGSRVHRSDSGSDCGELRQLIVEPAVLRVTDLVVHSPADGSRMVPISLAEPVGPEISLDCAREEFAALPAPARRPRRVTLESGDRVQAIDGTAGHVEGVAVEAGSGKIVKVLVAAGPWWHRRHVAVSAAVIPGFGPEGVRILMSKEQVKELGSVGMRQGIRTPASDRPKGPEGPGSSSSITHP